MISTDLFVTGIFIVVMIFKLLSLEWTFFFLFYAEKIAKAFIISAIVKVRVDDY